MRELDDPTGPCSIPRAIRLISAKVAAELGRPVPPLGTSRAATIVQLWLPIVQAEIRLDMARQSQDAAKIEQAEREVSHANITAEHLDKRRREAVARKSIVKRAVIKNCEKIMRDNVKFYIKFLLSDAVVTHPRTLEEAVEDRKKLMDEFMNNYDEAVARVYHRHLPTD